MSSEPVKTPKSRRVLLIGCAVGVAAIGLAVSGIMDRAKSKQELETWTNEQAVPTVRLVQAVHGPSNERLVLPGNVSAYYTGSLFARASGYVTVWNKDIGAHVKKGDVLAVIAAPDLDQQLAEAKAQLVQMQAAVTQAQANADLGRVTDQRTSRLVAQGWSSQQQGDTDRLTAASRVAALEVARANVTAQQAVVSRLEELTRFERITAPFDGIVTARTVDIGDLVNAGGTSGKALFQVSDVHEMRIYVNVPQAFLGVMKPGIKATLELPGQKERFEATLVSTANAIVENSRTALVELQAPNPDGKLWPGAFAEVHFHIPSDPETLRVPATALIFGPNGMSVAAVNKDSKVELKQVRVGRNLGDDVEIRSGVSLSDRLIDNPLESLASGDVVQVAGASPALNKEASRAETAM
ncbi:Efflux transporter, RND family, MFP subunit [Methylocella tundrae]|uniref:Efflux transporter, RND family, MFP subunit n=2 Tax=Methylocella tundrae TaxID=227605 RepID=A0A4U8YZH7_METTU|nr:efflux RND transporter periplasmic adaptor subunit [Methylocella tundrae]WPP05993.1 efflux RND transporter periplasmic adaptor subunit [Methylocella tundrae]VFU08567.1 Efflux transporter, RND family, MFP subunit [Methylocella tundrae]